jgi:phosphatidylserine decarboxylase
VPGSESPVFPPIHWRRRFFSCCRKKQSAEQPFADWIVTFFYAQEREHASFVFKLLASQSFSRFLGWLNYDFPLGQNIAGGKRFLQRCAIDLRECTESLGGLDSARKIFERKIRYWQCRPMSEIAAEIVCPADSRVLFGSLRDSSSLFLKSKFFDYEELLGLDKPRCNISLSAVDILMFGSEKIHLTKCHE